MSRKKLILSLLAYSDGAITVEKIANKLNISAKTIRNELSELEDITKRHDINIIKKPGKGILIEGKSSSIQKLINYMNENDDLSGDSPVERQRKILLRLFATNTPLMIKELRLDFYVSRTTITKDVKVLNDWLVDFNLKIAYEKSQGLMIWGKESDKRSALSKLLPSEYFYNAISNLEQEDLEKDYKNLLENFKEIVNVDIEILGRIIHEAEEELGYKFSTEAFVNLAIHIAIAIRRSQSGNEIDLTEELLEALNNKSEYIIADNTAKKIEKSFDIKLSDAEIYYILLHFLGSKTIKNNVLNFDFKLTSKEQIIEKVILEFIKRVEISLHMYLEADIQLFNSLLLHIKPTINRMLYGLSLSNPLTNQIKESYLEIFITISKHIHVINDAFNIDLPEDEIGYLTLHFAAAIERSTKNIRVIIACASGIGMSQLIVAKIERLFKNIKIIAVVSILEINSYKAEDIDLIISTVNISDINGIKTIVVNPLLNDYDISNIRNSINTDNSKVLKVNLFDEKNIYLNMSFLDKEELLVFINKQLIKHKYVSDKYLKSLVEREKIGSTYIGNGIAVVHGSKEEVIGSCIQIISLTNPITWNKDRCVEFIINAVASEKDSKKFTEIFKKIGTRLDDKKFWRSIKETTDKQSLVKLLNKELNYDYR